MFWTKNTPDSDMVTTFHNGLFPGIIYMSDADVDEKIDKSYSTGEVEEEE